MTRKQISLVVKLNFLVLGLFVAVFLSYNLKKKGLSENAKAVLGVAAPKSGTQTKQTWCDTRVSALIRPNEFKLEQKADKWIVEQASLLKELNFISVEKWFGVNCTVPGQAAPAPQSTEEQESFTPALIVKFVTGDVEPLRKSQDGRYLWRGQAFTSPTMDKALEDLGKLAETGSAVQKE